MILFAFTIIGAVTAAPAEYYNDFRGRPLPPELSLFQVQKEAAVQMGPEGLRIKIPDSWIHPQGGGATIARLIQADNEQVVLWNWERGPKTVEAEHNKGNALPCTDLVGRLRLTRTGTSLVYAWASGMQGEEFKGTQTTFAANRERARFSVGAGGRRE